MLYLFRYLPKQVTLDIFVLDNFMSYNDISIMYLQSVSKKMSFSGKTAITTFKLIQNAKVGGVLENSGYLLQHGH